MAARASPPIWTAVLVSRLASNGSRTDRLVWGASLQLARTPSRKVPPLQARNGHSAHLTKTNPPSTYTRVIGRALICGRGKAIVLTLCGRWHAHRAERSTASAGRHGGRISRCYDHSAGRAFSGRGFCTARQRQPAPARRGRRGTSILNTATA